MVRDMPRLTKASPPAARTRSTTPAISVSPASAVITTTISSSSSHKENPGPSGPGFPVKSLPSEHGLAGDRPGPGPVAKPKPELLTHDRHGSACRQAGGQKPTSRVMVLPRGAWPTGLKSNTLLLTKYLFTLTWNPASSSSLVAFCTVMPIGSGTLTSCGPVDTWTTTVWPGWNVAPPPGCWLITVPP